jgi:hypothetical protein
MTLSTKSTLLSKCTLLLVCAGLAAAQGVSRTAATTASSGGRLIEASRSSSTTVTTLARCTVVPATLTEAQLTCVADTAKFFYACPLSTVPVAYQDASVNCNTDVPADVSAWIANAWKATPNYPFSDAGEGDVAAIQNKRAADAANIESQTSEQSAKDVAATPAKCTTGEVEELKADKKAAVASEAAEDTQTGTARAWSVTGANDFAKTKLLDAAKLTATDYCKSL